MNLPFALTSVSGIVVALVLFIILKKVIGLVFRLILVGVLILAVVVGAWWWTRPGNANDNNNNTRPRRTQRDANRN